MSELTSEQVAAAFDRPLPTVKRWLRQWYASGVAGIRRGKAPGALRWGYLCAPDLVARWRSGDLPTPWSALPLAA